jgi:thaumarchaeosortase
MPKVLDQIRSQPSILLPLLPLIAFIIPLIGLYLLNPVEPFTDPNYIQLAQATFESMWKGRTFELFFVWLIGLELILGWENFREIKITKLFSPRGIALVVALIVPTLYVCTSYPFGLNDAIVKWALANNIQGGWATTMPVSIEYLAFAIFFTAITFLMFGKKGLINFAIPAFFMVMVGAIYIVDNVYPYGQFTLFQAFVPTAAASAAAIFNLMGYTTFLTDYSDPTHGTMPILTVSGPLGSTQFGIAWPCAGIESFLIYTVVVLLFLKRMPISWKAKIGFFVFGAAVTYFINILRIVTIFTIGMQYGSASPEVDLFHSYYGPLYSITWIIAYPLVIFLAQGLWNRHKNGKILNASAPSNMPIK